MIVKFLILSFLVTNIIYSQNKTEMAICNVDVGCFARGIGPIININLCNKEKDFTRGGGIHH